MKRNLDDIVLDEILKMDKIGLCSKGFGNKYFDIINAHVPLRDAARTDSLNAFINACFSTYLL